MINKSHSTLGILIPTNQPEIMFNFLLSDESLLSLKSVAPYATFLINFQSPWTESSIESCVSRLKAAGFSVKYCYNSYTIAKRGHVPFNNIRNDCAKLMPEAKYYLLMDDDMISLPRKKINISHGDQIVAALKYMEMNPKCGVISLERKVNEAVVNNQYKGIKLLGKILPVFGALCETSCGLIVRSATDQSPYNLFPKGSLDLVGWGEEMIILSYRYWLGYYYAKLYGASCLHKENKTSDVEEASSGSKVLTGIKKYGWGVRIAIENNYKYIKTHYNDKFSMESNDYDNIMNMEKYLSNGGIPNDVLINNNDYIYDYVSDMTRSDTNE